MQFSLKFRQGIYKITAPKTPRRFTDNFKTPKSGSIEKISSYLREQYFTKTVSEDLSVVDAFLGTNEGVIDMANQSQVRLDGFRANIIPWLDDAKSLAGAKILEIGCGTGSSTVALAEQGAQVTGIDIDEASLQVARERCREYGVDAEFFQSNATELAEQFQDTEFDFVIYFACLEHMTHEERMSAMKSTWDMLPKGGLWTVIETPNRIWYDDHHTAHMPYFMWLPDDLAYKYAKLSPRESLNSANYDNSEDSHLTFLRAGRGVSFHEFDLTIGKSENLDVVSSLSSFNDERNKLWSCGRRITFSPNSRYEAFLKKVSPNLHQGFRAASLDLIIRKR